MFFPFDRSPFKNLDYPLNSNMIPLNPQAVAQSVMLPPTDPSRFKLEAKRTFFSFLSNFMNFNRYIRNWRLLYREKNTHKMP